MDRRQLLKRLEEAWSDFQGSYAGLSNPQLLNFPVTGKWSTRDIIAHVTTWEEEALKYLPLILEGGKPPRYSVTHGGIDAFNALMTKKKAGLSLSEVFRQQGKIHGRLIELIKRAPESQLSVETRFRRRLRVDTYGHYPVHARAIRKWRQQTTH